jgi:hypothetical protein
MMFAPIDDWLTTEPYHPRALLNLHPPNIHRLRQMSWRLTDAAAPDGCRLNIAGVFLVLQGFFPLILLLPPLARAC